MTENEIIIVDGIPDNEYHSLMDECVKYALLSLPFTINRMHIGDEKRRVANIAKGKIAEALFQTFCKKNSIKIDAEVCTTPFWTVDNRDFVLNSNEWDIKNNFIYHEKQIFKGNYTDLPALVPNRYKGDQWSKRNEKLVAGTNGVTFLFTFLKNADLVEGERCCDFIEININHQQQSFLSELLTKYHGYPQAEEPYSSQWFWENMESRGDNNYFTLNAKPHLVITGFADRTHWNLFKNTGPDDFENNFQSHKPPSWYNKYKNGTCKFLNGTLWTTITNATTPVATLPSFLSLFPSLKSGINAARIKQQ